MCQGVIPFPDIFSTTGPASGGHSGSQAGGQGSRGGPGTSAALPLRVDPQTEINWCWAAVAASVSRYYSGRAMPQQCDVVNMTFNNQSCCANGRTFVCDRAWHLEDALTLLGNLDSQPTTVIPFDEIRRRIDADRPVCCRVADPLNPRVGHFIVIIGYQNGSRQWVVSDDPKNGTRRHEYSQITSAYLNQMLWTHTFHTKP